MILAFAALVVIHTARAVFDVRAFGAKGDGTTFDTASINAAIAAAHAAGGGTVLLPPGTYVSYTLRLKSNVTLHLEAGATLLAAEPVADDRGGFAGYDAPEPNPWAEFQDFGHSHWRNSLIWGESLENIAIAGSGRIYGRGLTRGYNQRVRDPIPFEPGAPPPPTFAPIDPASIKTGPFGYPAARDTLPAGIGNKAIALKNCRNVIIRDITIFHGGHFGILASGVDNMTLDNLKIDTNRDGIDIDGCRNVRVSNCSVNAPLDDAICLKSSMALGVAKPCENITITNCLVSGFDEGSMLNSTFKRSTKNPGGPFGRIKFGTESNGAFRQITISNCVFDFSRGIALETVDGASLEDIVITNLTMRDVPNAPIFIRLGARLRAPAQTAVGVCRRIRISNVVAQNVASDHGILIAGLSGHPIEDVSLNDISIHYRGGGTMDQGRREVPELATNYPEPANFGVLPSWGVFARHVRRLTIHHVNLHTAAPDFRPAVILDDVVGARLDHVTLPKPPGSEGCRFVFRHVADIVVTASGLANFEQRELLAHGQW